MRHYIGIDVGKQALVVAVCQGGESWELGRFSNDAGGLEAMGQAMGALSSRADPAAVHLILEATGGYELALLNWAATRGWPATRVNGYQVRHWGQGMGQRAKTDAQDALLLAAYGAARQPAAEEPLAASVQELDALLQQRQDLAQVRRSTANRLQSARRKPATPAAVIDSLQRTLQHLEAEDQAIVEAIQQLLKENPDLRHQYRLLLSLPGVGDKTVLPLLVLLHRFYCLTRGQGSAKELTAYLGLDPRPYESGSSVYRRATISRMGDKMGRSLLYMAALGGVRGHNPLRHFYRRLVGRGKAKKLALVAAARKILVWSWAIFCSQQPFDPARTTPA